MIRRYNYVIFFPADLRSTRDERRLVYLYVEPACPICDLAAPNVRLYKRCASCKYHG